MNIYSNEIVNEIESTSAQEKKTQTKIPLNY